MRCAASPVRAVTAAGLDLSRLASLTRVVTPSGCYCLYPIWWLYVCREIWKFFTASGTLQAVWTAPTNLLSGNSLSLPEKHHRRRRRHRKGGGRSSMEASRNTALADPPLNWCDSPACVLIEACALHKKSSLQLLAKPTLAPAPACFTAEMLTGRRAGPDRPVKRCLGCYAGILMIRTLSSSEIV